MISPKVGLLYIFLTIPQDSTQCWLFHKFMLSNFKLGLAVFDPGPCNLERVSLPELVW